jgi:hypothetical protein
LAEQSGTVKLAYSISPQADIPVKKAWSKWRYHAGIYSEADDEIFF